jgi:hypothetical protein
MKTQKPLPNPPDEYEKKYMFDLASLVIDEESTTLKVDRDNIMDKGSIILRSPNGSFFRVVVADNGTLSATAVATVSNRPVTSVNPYV